MRTIPVLLALSLSSLTLQAQDPGMAAAQQAAQAAQQASQDAMRANEEASRRAQEASDEAMRASQQAAQNAQTIPVVQPASRPKFSLKPGSYSGPVTVKIREATRGAVVYYTTDGWTPTTSSPRYTGPVTITTTTTLQAIAVAPAMPTSRLANGLYVIRPSAGTGTPDAKAAPEIGAQPASASAHATGPRVLPKDTPVPLAFAADYSSRKADVGDKLTLFLAENVSVGGVLLIRKGAPAIVNVIEAHKSGVGGHPGFVSFEAETLNVDGTIVKLRGVVAKEGKEVQVNPVAVGLAIVPAGLLLVHGNEAEIKHGSVFTAAVAEEAKLPEK